MKKHLLTAVAILICTFAAISMSSGQTASFIYDDGNGTPNVGSYTPGSSFTFSINLAFTPGGAVPNLAGLSYWFEQQNPNSPFNFAITLRNVTGSPFTDLQTPGLTYPQTLAPQNVKDLGALDPNLTGFGAGTYFVANVTVSIDSGTVLGTYLIENTTTAPGKTSVISDNLGHTFAIPQATYEIDVVPEPATWVAGALVLATLLAFHHWRRIARLK